MQTRQAVAEPKFSELTDCLPPLAIEMLRVLGEEATLKLIHEMGGRRLTVPGWPLKRPSSRFEYLEEVVGADAARAFADRWGGVEIQVPLCVAAFRRLRDLQVISDYGRGVAPAELARQHKLTEGNVWRILKKSL